jgi:hypothetical protein
MRILSSNINITDRNTEVPFYPSFSYQIINSDMITSVNDIVLPPFFWIQAFFDAESLTAPAQLAIYSGAEDDAGNPIVSIVRFAYSGEMKNFKGLAIFTSGEDIRGDTIESTPIGATTTTDLLNVIAYSGMY